MNNTLKSLIENVTNTIQDSWCSLTDDEQLEFVNKLNRISTLFNEHHLKKDDLILKVFTQQVIELVNLPESPFKAMFEDSFSDLFKNIVNDGESFKLYICTSSGERLTSLLNIQLIDMLTSSGIMYNDVMSSGTVARLTDNGKILYLKSLQESNTKPNFKEILQDEWMWTYYGKIQTWVDKDHQKNDGRDVGHWSQWI